MSKSITPCSSGGLQVSIGKTLFKAAVTILITAAFMLALQNWILKRETHVADTAFRAGYAKALNMGKLPKVGY